MGSDPTFSIPVKTDGPVETVHYGLELNRRLKVRVTDVLHNFNPTLIASFNIVNIELRNLK